MWRQIAKGSVVLAGLAVLASFGGDLHASGDSLAVFRPILLIACLACAALVWRWRGGQGLVVAVVCVSVWQAGGGAFASRPDAPDLIVYQKNLLFWERDRSAFIADVVASRADVVTLQEIGPSNEAVLEAMRGTYPHQLLCNATRARNVAVLSRTALIEADCPDLRGAARVVTRVRGRDVQVYAVHLFWPWPYGQAAQVAAMGPVLEGHAAPFTVIAGDFNMVPTGRSLAAIARAADVQRIGRAPWTYSFKGYPLAIDHVLASGGAGVVEARDMMGSDHRGLVAYIEWRQDQ